MTQEKLVECKNAITLTDKRHYFFDTSRIELLIALILGMLHLPNVQLSTSEKSTLLFGIENGQLIQSLAARLEVLTNVLKS